MSQLDTTTASEAVKKIIADAMAAIENLPYDPNKSLEENKQAVDALLAQITQSMAGLESLEENKNAFEDYKANAIKQADAMHTAGESEAVRKLIDDAMAAIEKLRYDETKSLAQNKKAIDDILAQLQKDLKAARRTKTIFPPPETTVPRSRYGECCCLRRSVYACWPCFPESAGIRRKNKALALRSVWTGPESPRLMRNIAL